jgi:hypothetical protein
MSLLILESFFAVLAAAVSLAAFTAYRRSRRLAKRIERLAESYWELKYEQGQLNARLERLEGGAQGAPPAGATAFVPLSSLKKP